MANQEQDTVFGFTRQALIDFHTGLNSIREGLPGSYKADEGREVVVVGSRLDGVLQYTGLLSAFAKVWPLIETTLSEGDQLSQDNVYPHVDSLLSFAREVNSSPLGQSLTGGEGIAQEALKAQERFKSRIERFILISTAFAALIGYVVGERNTVWPGVLTGFDTGAVWFFVNVNATERIAGRLFRRQAAGRIAEQLPRQFRNISQSMIEPIRDYLQPIAQVDNPRFGLQQDMRAMLTTCRDAVIDNGRAGFLSALEESINSIFEIDADRDFQISPRFPFIAELYQSYTDSNDERSPGARIELPDLLGVFAPEMYLSLANASGVSIQDQDRGYRGLLEDLHPLRNTLISFGALKGVFFNRVTDGLHLASRALPTLLPERGADIYDQLDVFLENLSPASSTV